MGLTKGGVASSRHNESEKRLPKSCLVALCKYEPVLRWTRECDNLLYQTLVEMLIPDVLRPIPSRSHCERLDSLLFLLLLIPILFFFSPSGALTQAIRNFAKSLESWLTGAMMDIPEEMVRVKVRLLSWPDVKFSTLVLTGLDTFTIISNAMAFFCLYRSFFLIILSNKKNPLQYRTLII